MAKARSIFVCQSCGAQFPKWMGRCQECGEWNTVTEEMPASTGGLAGLAGLAGKAAGNAPRRSGMSTIAPGSAQAVPLAEVADHDAASRLATGIPEVERVLGGGLLPGSVCLLGGDPGIGKSTLVLQLLDKLGAAGHAGLYISGEESAGQIKNRAQRLSISGANVHLLAEVELERMAPEIERLTPALIVVDSIQTVRTGELDSIAGNVSQVRACAARLIHHAKTHGATVLLIGHVTKEGALAGPRTLEHMVDVVLYLEGASERPQRILRSVKNRFGPTGEIGLFQMTETGLEAVSNPSTLFLEERSQGAPGTVVFAGMEGTRPLLIEIQALVGDNASPYARRTAVGMDGNRVALLQAVVEKHLGDNLGGLDIYLNVVGGLRLNEPALDAAALAAMLSSYRKRPMHPTTILFGEVGLAGELRGVSHAAERLAEAARLGFTRAILPTANAKGLTNPPKELEIHGASSVADLAELVLGR